MTLLQAYLRSPKARRTLSKRPGDQGFSLIELVVVVAILAILAAVALPNFLGVSKDGQIAAAKNTIATVLKECAVKETRTGNALYGGTTGNIQAATANLNGYILTYDDDPSKAVLANKISLTGNAPVGADKSCYSITAMPASGVTLPAYTATFNPLTGETKKICHGMGNATYLTGCNAKGTQNTAVANANTEGEW